MKQGMNQFVRTMMVVIFSFGVVAEISGQQSHGRAKRKPQTVFGGTYYSLTLNLPPFPFNPFPDLPVYSIGDGKLVYDDSSVDYLQLRAETAALRAERSAMQLESAELDSGGAAMLMGGSGPRLAIELVDEGNTKRMSFDTQPGLVYNVEQSTNLVNWTLLETMVANSTNAAFFSFDDTIRFYRVIQNDDRIQFPDWEDFIEQYLNFDVFTSIQGTYHLELYGDGNLIYQTTQVVPANGLFGVYDGQYDPNQWPNTGAYSVNDWELRVTVTPVAASQGSPQPTAQAIVKKKSRRRNANRVGVTVQQYNAFTISFLIQDEIDDWMHNYFLGSYQGAVQVALNGSLLNEFTDPSGVPKLLDTNYWGQLKNLLYSPSASVLVTDMHYFGHGGSSIIAGC